MKSYSCLYSINIENNSNKVYSYHKPKKEYITVQYVGPAFHLEHESVYQHKSVTYEITKVTYGMWGLKEPLSIPDSCVREPLPFFLFSFFSFGLAKPKRRLCPSAGLLVWFDVDEPSK